MALLMEIGWGGLVQNPDTISWTDISQRVDMIQGISITRGASDEIGSIDVGTLSARLNNDDGRFTPGNPASPYSPYVRRNAPIRCAVTTTTPRTGSGPWPLIQLADDFDDGVVDSALWGASYGGVAEVDGKARLTLAAGTPGGFLSARQWTLANSQFSIKIQALPGANGSSAASTSVMVNSTTAGTRAGFTYDAIAGTLCLVSEVSFADGAAVALSGSGLDNLWLRLRHAGTTLYWETSFDGADWTIRRSITAPAWVAAQQVTVELSGTRTGGTAGYAEYDLANHAVRSRFYGTLNDLPTAWAGLMSTVSITASDLFKRLNRLPPLKSALAEEILLPPANAFTILSAYFPLNEPEGATSVGDISGAGAGALNLAQLAIGGTMEFGTDGLPATGDTCVTFTPASASAGKYLSGDLGAQYQSDSNSTNGHTTLGLVIEFWFKTTTTGRAICGLYEPGFDHQIIFALSATGVLTVESTDIGTPLTLVTTSSGILTDGQWHHVIHDNNSKSIWVDGVQFGGVLNIAEMNNLRTLQVGGYRSARMFAGQVAHVAIRHANQSIAAALTGHYDAGMTGFAGEPADQRIARLAGYASVASVTVWGSTHDPVASQGEGGTGALARMQEVEATESARLFAERQRYGLAYQSRDVRYNPDPSSEAFTVEYADLETGGVELADDDQKLVNSVQAMRPGGATQRATASQSVTAFGLYEKQLTLLKTSDPSVLDAAYWTVSRYANPAPELREVPVEAYTHPAYSSILDAEISSYFSVYNLPAEAPASQMRVTVEGYTEVIKEQSHLITFHTSNSIQDSVWVLEDPVYGVLDVTTRLAY